MNPFRQLLRARGAKAPIGTWITSVSPIVAEAVGSAGFDWGVLDLEHTPLDLMDLVHLLQAVGNTKMVPLVRVPWNDGTLLRRVLDADAESLLLPAVDDARAAASAVALTRYPPAGVRGVSTMGRASRYGTVPDFFRSANRRTGVVLQLETPQAIARLEEIAAVDGVDALFVGPGDLSGSLGVPGELTHPKVMAMMADAAQRARALGKPIGTVGATPETVARYRAAGFDFLAVSSDLGLLMRGAQVMVQALRAGDGAVRVHTLAEGTATEAGG